MSCCVALAVVGRMAVGRMVVVVRVGVVMRMVVGRVKEVVMMVKMVVVRMVMSPWWCRWRRVGGGEGDEAPVMMAVAVVVVVRPCDVVSEWLVVVFSLRVCLYDRMPRSLRSVYRACY